MKITKTRIKDSLKGYVMKRTKSEIIDKIQEMIESIEGGDGMQRITLKYQIVTLLWASGMEPQKAIETIKELIKEEK